MLSSNGKTEYDRKDIRIEDRDHISYRIPHLRKPSVSDTRTIECRVAGSLVCESVPESQTPLLAEKHGTNGLLN